MWLLAQLVRRLIRRGSLTVVDADGRAHRFEGDRPGIEAVIRLHDRSVYRRLALNPELRFGEAYMDGTLTLEEGFTLRDLLAVLVANRDSLDTMAFHSTLQRLRRALKWAFEHNPIGRAEKNVAHHYDLSRELYELFLDDDLQYSCAYFADADDSLEAAQLAKKRHIASKLHLSPGQRVLDIGCGWGGMALYLAKMFDVEVTGVTLSREQHAAATQRARAEGLDGKVSFALRDYRKVEGSFDRIVSVGMFEHVGVPQFRRYFECVERLLADDGVALLHSIGRRDGPGTTGPWLRKYIFPGGYSPALSETLQAVERTGLWVTDIEILRLHYAETLHHWHQRFLANHDRIAELYDERFCRMWEFYLVACEMVFRYGDQMVFQMQLARRLDSLPITRDYMPLSERSLAEAEGRPMPHSLAG